MRKEDDLWKSCPTQGWSKLGRTCTACGKGHADIEILFASSGLPEGYLRSGQFGRSWHWNCLPQQLKQYQANDEAEWFQAVQRPFGS